MTADKMSRGCSKVYSRKLNSVSQTSIQFDKLFHENSNRPSAAKSAGTIGKWGVISCTSLRSSNFNTCRDDIISNKRMRLDYGSQNSQNSSQSKDPFSFETDGDKLLTEQNQQMKVVAKPKKFFKSRNVDLISGEDIRYYTGNKRSNSNYATQGGKKYCKGNFASRTQYDSATSESIGDGGSKKLFTATGSLNSGDTIGQQIEAVNLSSPSKATAPLREENKPPIVLRIFKGTSHLVSDVKETSNVPLPSKSTSENQGLNLRSTRRRHMEVNESWSSSLHDGKDRQAHVSITSPKKSNRIVKDKVIVHNSSPSNSLLGSIGCDSEVKSVSSGSIVNKYASPEANAENTFTDHEGRARSKDSVQSDATDSFIGMGIMHDEKENISNEDVCESIKDRAAPMTYCAQSTKSASGLDIRSYSELEQPQINTIDHDEEKLSQAEELLSSTYVDFRTATEKLLLEPKGSCMSVSDGIDFSSSVTNPSPEVKESCRLMLEVDFSTGMKLDCEENVSINLKRENFQADAEKMLNEEKDSCKTILDSIEFNTTSEQLITEPKDSCKTILDLFTDSEDSNSIADQINTIASSQGEVEIENQARYKVNEEKDAGVADVIASSHTVMQETIVADMECTSGQVSNNSVTERTNSPATKKGSIFKSRSLLSDGSKKRLALYKHKWVDDGTGGFSQGGEQTTCEGSLVQPTGTTGSYSDAEEEFETPKLVRVITWPTSNAAIDEAKAVTSLKCNKTAKGYFTVIRNVKKAHQIQESGEFQEFNDDVEYILDALQDNNPVGTRCLSAITLASKCMAPAFRMHVRAHGTVAKFFRALHDAAKDQSLALCTATVMFVLSQDRLNMDLDRDSLELMLNLLESDASHHNALEYCGMSSTQLHKNKKKVRELCAEIQSQGHAKHLNIDNITVGQLAMETLLSLTSHRAGEWFKEELRELGGLEHIVKTINDCCTQVDDYIIEWKEPLLDKLRKLDRCLRVLENVTNQNEENQMYLLKYENGILIDTLARLYRKCDGEIVMYPVSNVADKESPGVVIHELLLTILKVLINLTHSFSNTSVGSSLVGGRPGIIDASLHVLLQVPSYIPEEKKFDLLVLVLIFLINLVEHSTSNRNLLFEAKAPLEPDVIFHSSDERTAVEALISLFYQHEELARVEGIKTDAILDGKNDSEPDSELPKSTEEFIEETVAKLLQKAGRNMEHTLIGSYLGLLIGYLITDNKEHEMFVRECLPQKNFSIMISVLEKVYNFMNLASAISSSRGITQTRRIINYLEQSDAAAISSKTATMEDVNFHLDVVQPATLKDA